MIRNVVKTAIERLEPYIDKIDKINFELQCYLDYDEESKKFYFDFLRLHNVEKFKKLRLPSRSNMIPKPFLLSLDIICRPNHRNRLHL